MWSTIINRMWWSLTYTFEPYKIVLEMSRQRKPYVELERYTYLMYNSENTWPIGKLFFLPMEYLYTSLPLIHPCSKLHTRRFLVVLSQTCKVGLSHGLWNWLWCQIHWVIKLAPPPKYKLFQGFQVGWMRDTLDCNKFMLPFPRASNQPTALKTHFQNDPS